MEGDFPLQPGEIQQELWIQMLHLVKKDHNVCYRYYFIHKTFKSIFDLSRHTPGVDDCCVPTEVMPIG